MVYVDTERCAGCEFCVEVCPTGAMLALITTLEFVPDPVQALSEAIRVARHGLILGVLNRQSLLAWRRKRSGEPLWQEARFFTPVEKVVASAGKTMVLFSGGSKISDEDLLLKARICVEAGATGLIFGRNMWQRPFEEGLRVTGQVKQILQSGKPSS
ncbi:MAG: 4Fe-4S binding protein [Anaerolineae bacterium]